MTINEFHYIDKGPGYYVHKLTGEVWMTREQIGRMLGYTEPRQAVAKIHERHKEVLCGHYAMVDIYDTGCGYMYSIEGIFWLCFKSRQPQADDIVDAFYDFLGFAFGHHDHGIGNENTPTLIAAGLYRRLIKEGVI